METLYVISSFCQAVCTLNSDSVTLVACSPISMEREKWRVSSPLWTIHVSVPRIFHSISVEAIVKLWRNPFCLPLWSVGFCHLSHPVPTLTGRMVWLLLLLLPLLTLQVIIIMIYCLYFPRVQSYSNYWFKWVVYTIFIRKLFTSV